MPLMRRLLALLLGCASPAIAQVAGPPEFLGAIAGPGAGVLPPGVRFYGTEDRSLQTSFVIDDTALNVQ